MTKEDKEKISHNFNKHIELLEQLASNKWNYGCPDNEGWEVPLKLLKEVLDQKLLKQ